MEYAMLPRRRRLLAIYFCYNLLLASFVFVVLVYLYTMSSGYPSNKEENITRAALARSCCGI